MHVEYIELYNEAESFYANGNIQNALNICLEITSRNPSEFDANYYASVISFILNNFERASRFALNAFKLRPENKVNLIVLVKSLTKISLFEQASLFAKNFPGNFPDNEEIDRVLEEIKINPFKYEYQIRTLPKPLLKTKYSLNILFIQDAPCIRNYKYAAALKKRGHKVTLAYFIKKLSERYQGLDDDVYEDSIKITDFKQLWDLSKNFDLIHSHNEPDYYTIAALAGGIPVIHDTHDLISLREPENNQLKYFEGVANRGASGRIYSTPYQYKEAQDLYGVNGNSIVFYNYASGEHLPKNYLPKLSSFDGKIHLVYEGGVSGSDGKHRDFADQFVKLSQLGYFVHIYPAAFNADLNSFFSVYPNIVYNKPVSPGALIEIMTQFDFGIIPWNMEKGNVRFLSSTIANKLFEYLAAGIPVAAADIISYRDFFKKNHVGITFNSIEDFHSKIDILQQIKAEMTGKKIEFTYESEIEKVEKFYLEILGKKKTPSGKEAIINEDKNAASQQNIEAVIFSSFEKLQSWIDSNGWAGYDPYDIEDFIMSAKSKGMLSEQDEQKIRHFNEIEPLLCREKLKIEKKINAKALGLLLSSYSILYSVLNDKKYLVEAEEIAEWLLKNRSSGYKNMCWGYPFDWQSKIFIPKGTPSVVVSAVVGDGFWQLYNVTRNELYLEICISICEFITEDLNCDLMDEKRICFSYTPFDNFHVHNANLFAGEFLARIGKEISINEWVEKGIKTANYALSEQNTNGSIYYWGLIQDSYNPKHLDSYHSGFEIRLLYGIYYHSGIEEIKVAADKYLEFYLNTYINSDGSTLQFPPGKKSSQVNIHGAAETILLLSSFAKEKKELKNYLQRCLNWTINNLQHEDGWFGYLIKENQKIMIPFMRWGEAWMMRGLVEYFTFFKIETGEWGYYNFSGTNPGIKANPEQTLSVNSQLNALYKLTNEYLDVDSNFIPQNIIDKINKIFGTNCSSFEIIKLIKNKNHWDNYIFQHLKKIPDHLNVNKKRYKDYQISMPQVSGLKYGSYEWNEYLYKNSKTDPWGQDWRASQIIRYKKSIELIDKNVKKESINSVLDVGCATGYFLEYLKKSLAQSKIFTGVDISNEAIIKCKSNYKEDIFMTSSMPALLELESSKYDLISALEVICYVSENELYKAILRLKELLNIGGYLLISIYMNQPPFYSPENFKTFISKNFVITDEEIRYHKPFYKLESPLREIMHEIKLNNETISNPGEKIAEEFLQSSFNLLSNISFLEYFNEKAKISGLKENISHSIILARNL